MGNPANDTSLVLLDEARARLARVASVDDAKKIRDQAAAMEHYARQQKGALDAANKASEIKVRAERRIGELLKAVPRVEPKDAGKRGGRPSKTTPHDGESFRSEVVVLDRDDLDRWVERQKTPAVVIPVSRAR